jgi:uncharacterized membrane protein YjjP (DUF1212 family)
MTTHDELGTLRRSDDQPGMREFLDFLREISGLLIECGCSSNRVELLTQKLGMSWGYEVEALAIPTGVWITVRKGATNLVEMTRVRSWSVDLDRLARLNDLVDSIYDHKISIHEARSRLKAERHQRPPYSRALTLLAGAGSSPILVHNYGGSPLEVALALPLGIGVVFLSKYVFTGDEARRHIGDFMGAAFVALYACVAHSLLPAVQETRLIVGGIVVLVPGLILVNAVHEVAQKNLVSGAAKLLEAFMITASLAFGVVFVLGIRMLF